MPPSMLGIGALLLAGLGVGCLEQVVSIQQPGQNLYVGPEGVFVGGKRVGSPALPSVPVKPTKTSTTSCISSNASVPSFSLYNACQALTLINKGGFSSAAGNDAAGLYCNVCNPNLSSSDALSISSAAGHTVTCSGGGGTSMVNTSSGGGGGVTQVNRAMLQDFGYGSYGGGEEEEEEEEGGFVRRLAKKKKKSKTGRRMESVDAGDAAEEGTFARQLAKKKKSKPQQPQQSKPTNMRRMESFDTDGDVASARVLRGRRDLRVVQVNSPGQSVQECNGKTVVTPTQGSAVNVCTPSGSTSTTARRLSDTQVNQSSGNTGGVSQVNASPSGSQVNTNPNNTQVNSSSGSYSGSSSAVGVGDVFTTCSYIHEMWSNKSYSSGKSYAKSLYCELGCGNLCSAQKNSLRAQVGTLIQC